jgi:hypothetical protein
MDDYLIASLPGMRIDTIFPSIGGLHWLSLQAMYVILISSSIQPFPGGSSTGKLNVTAPSG